MSPQGVTYYRQGQDAYHEGRPISVNPFFEGTEARKEWRQGWNDAKAADKRASDPKTDFTK